MNLIRFLGSSPISNIWRQRRSFDDGAWKLGRLWTRHDIMSSSPAIGYYYTFNSLSLFWLAESVQGIFERARIFQCFSSHYPKRFRQTTLKWEWWRPRRSLINPAEWRDRWVTCQQLIGDIKQSWKYTIFFQVCCSGFSQGWKSLYNTVVYMIKTFAARTTSKMMPPLQDHEDFSSKIFSYIGVQFFRHESK